MIGQTISHYRVVDRLGIGGMGVVYRAEDPRLEHVMQLTDELEVHRAILAASLGGICLATCLRRPPLARASVRHPSLSNCNRSLRIDSPQNSLHRIN
jgi:hypothetical protein